VDEWAVTGPVHAWRLSRRVPLIKGTVAAGFALVAVLTGADVVRLSLAAAAAAVLLTSALRDVLAPVRLFADTSGVTVVVGFAGHRRIPWSEVERLRVDVTRRFGLQKHLVEIDTGETLHLISPAELGADPHEVVATLVGLRTGHTAN
jgi:hypothetical protein